MQPSRLICPTSLDTALHFFSVCDTMVVVAGSYLDASIPLEVMKSRNQSIFVLDGFVSVVSQRFSSSLHWREDNRVKNVLDTSTERVRSNE